MQKIIAALIAAIAFVFSSREATAGLKAEIATRDAIITDLRAALEADTADDAALEAAAAAAKAAQEAAEASLAALLAQITEAEAKADEALAAISADTEIPVVIENGVATELVAAA